MSYYTEPNTITKEMLMQLVTDDTAKNVDKISNAIMNRYKTLESLGNDGDEDKILDIMYTDREKMKTMPKTAPNWDEMEDDEQKVWIQKVINAGLFKPKHGDGFHWLGDGYRNEGLWFWDKNKGVIPPCTKYDDYGGVPDHFLVGNDEDQFLPNKWKNIVDHNSYVFLAPELMKEIKDTAKSVMTTSTYREKPYKIWHTSVMIKKSAYAVQINIDDIGKIDNVFTFEEGLLYKED